MTIEKYYVPLIGGPLDGKRAQPRVRFIEGNFMGRYELVLHPVVRGDEVDFEHIYRFDPKWDRAACAID